MRDKTAQLLAVVIGIALIAIYSVLMIATEGSSAWAWILLIAGIITLIGGGLALRRNPTA